MQAETLEQIFKCHKNLNSWTGSLTPGRLSERETETTGAVNSEDMHFHIHNHLIVQRSAVGLMHTSYSAG